MRKRIGRYMTMVLAGMICLSMLVSCGGESKLDRYRAEKHERDSVGLVDQQRTLAYFQSRNTRIMVFIRLRTTRVSGSSCVMTEGTC